MYIPQDKSINSLKFSNQTLQYILELLFIWPYNTCIFTDNCDNRDFQSGNNRHRTISKSPMPNWGVMQTKYSSTAKHMIGLTFECRLALWQIELIKHTSNFISEKSNYAGFSHMIMWWGMGHNCGILWKYVTFHDRTKHMCQTYDHTGLNGWPS